MIQTFTRSVKIRRFGISLHSGKIVQQGKRPGVVKEVCDIPNPGNLTNDEFQRRADGLTHRQFQQLSGRRYDSDVISQTPDGKNVTTHQVEAVYNDWIILNTVCGLGTYEHVANGDELQVLQIAKKFFSV